MKRDSLPADFNGDQLVAIARLVSASTLNARLALERLGDETVDLGGSTP